MAELARHLCAFSRAALLLGEVQGRRKLRRVLRPGCRYFFPSDGLPVIRRLEPSELAEERLREALQERGWHLDAYAPQVQSWTLGSHSRLGTRWQVFDSEEEARAVFERTWLSRVLFDPRGVPSRCASGYLDAEGRGVAELLMMHRGKGGLVGRGDEALTAIRAGEVPFVPPHKPPFVQQALELVWRCVGRRDLLRWIHSDALCHVDAAPSPHGRATVALTIDDAPCRLGGEASMVPEVLELLRKHRARATFMVMGKFVDGSEEDLVEVLREGHELGNHGMVDRSYHRESREAFAEAVEECNGKIRALQRAAGVREGVRWFRAPHARYNQAMTQTLTQKGLTNVMCDTYACCPVIQDGEFVGRFLAENAEHGSIVLLHMPEHGFREWCLDGLRLLLEGLDERGIEVVTVGELVQRAEAQTAMATAPALA